MPRVEQPLTVPAGGCLDVAAGSVWTFARGAELRLGAGARLIGAGTLDFTGSGQRVIADGDDVRIGGVTIAGCDLPAITGSSNGLLVEGVTIRDCTDSGIYLENRSGAAVRGPIIRNVTIDLSRLPAATTQARGVKLYGVDPFTGTRVTDCTVRLPLGALLDGAIGVEVRRCPGVLVGDNTLTGGAMGVSIDDCLRPKVLGNAITGPTWYGVEIVTASSHGTITANTLDMGARSESPQSGIVFSGASGSTHWTVSGNTIGNFGTKTPQGINLASSPRFVTLTGNTVELPAAADGIAVHFPTSASRATVTGNVFTTLGAMYGVQCDGANGLLTITGNVFSGFTRQGVAILAAASGPIVTASNVTT